MAERDRIEELFQAVTRLETKVDALARDARPGGKQLLSRRAAARRLGLSRDTIADLILDRQIRPITVNGRSLIPAAELERFSREGTHAPGRKPRTPDARTAAEEAAALRAELRKRR